MTQALPEKKTEEQAASQPAAKPVLGAKKGDVVLRIGARAAATEEDMSAFSEDELFKRLRHAKSREVAANNRLFFVSALGLPALIGGGLGLFVSSSLFITAFPLIVPGLFAGVLFEHFAPGMKKFRRECRKLVKAIEDRQRERAVSTEEDNVRRAEALREIQKAFEALTPEEAAAPALAPVRKALEKAGLAPGQHQPRRLPGAKPQP